MNLPAAADLIPGPHLVCVDPARIDETWPHVQGLLAEAFESDAPDATLESTEHALRSGAALLWIVWSEDEKRILGAITTELWKTPAHKVCVITSGAGERIEQWAHYIANIEIYARDEGCQALRIFGRPGWEKIFPDFDEPWITLQKALT